MTTEATMDPSASNRLLYLLQVATASFPTGAFNHSYGFETWFDSEAIKDAASFETAVRDWLIHAVGPLDGVAVAQAQRAAASGDCAVLVELDHIVGAMRLTRETREASVKTGQSLLTTLCAVFDAPMVLADFAAAVRGGRCDGHQAVGFGAAAGAFGLSTEEAVLAYLQSSFANLAAVAARLVPIGQVETQRIIRRAWPLLISSTEEAVRADQGSMSAITVALDIASMRHQDLHTRLCMS